MKLLQPPTHLRPLITQPLIGSGTSVDHQRSEFTCCLKGQLWNILMLKEVHIFIFLGGRCLETERFDGNHSHSKINRLPTSTDPGIQKFSNKELVIFHYKI